MPSLLWSVREALYELLAETLVGTQVYDGPRTAGDVPKKFVVVGADSDDPFSAPGELEPDDTLTATATQEWSTMGPGAWRTEKGSVLCTAVAWSGDSKFGPLRAQVEELVDAIEAALLADRQLGGAIGTGVELAEVRVWERRTKKGAAVGAVLAVAYESELT